MKTKIVITGGHLGPALAVIELLEKDWDIHFIGRQTASESSSAQSVESQLVPQLGIPFYPITTGRFQRHFNLSSIKSLAKFPLGVFQSLRLVFQIHPQVILSFGGYVGLPVCIAGFMAKIPIVLHEQTTVAGLANRIASLFATKVAVSWHNVSYKFPASKTVYTGNPLQSHLNSHSQEKSSFTPNPKLPTLIVLGGNQGSHSINRLIIPLLPSLLDIANVIFQTGVVNTFDYEQASKISSSSKSGKLQIAQFFPPKQYASLLQSSDLVLARSGANTVTDVASLGKPAIFIPLPWSGGNEQDSNARLLIPYGSTVLDQSTLTSELLFEHLRSSLSQLPHLTKLASQANSLLNKEATRDLVKLLSQVVHI